MEFQIAWPSISRSFGANGRLVWHGEPVEASLTLTDFLAALSGQRSGVKVRVAGAPLKLAFDGAATAQPTLKLEGTLGVDAPSLRDAMRWTGKSKVPFGGFGRFALRAQSTIGGGVVSLANVNVELDGNTAEGVLTLSAGDRRMVQGTLAADALDLTPYVSGMRLLATNERNWDQLPIALDGLGDLNLDLRLSAASIKIANAQLGRTAVAANMRDGKLDVTIGESQAYGGVVKGAVGIASANGGVEAMTHVQFVDVDLESCLGQMFGVQKLAGRGNLMLNIDGAGNSVLALTNTLNGTASLTAHNGALVGLNVEQLLRRLERRPLSGNGDFRSGRTPFDQLVLNLAIDHGTVAVAGHAYRRAGGAACGRRPGLGADARSRPQRHRDLDLERHHHRVRAALRGAGPLGRPDHAARPAEPDPPFGGGRAVARCRQGPHRGRGGPLGDRPADGSRRPLQPPSRLPRLSAQIARSRLFRTPCSACFEHDLPKTGHHPRIKSEGRLFWRSCSMIPAHEISAGLPPATGAQCSTASRALWSRCWSLR